MTRPTNSMIRLARAAALGLAVMGAALGAPGRAEAATISPILSFANPICDLSKAPRDLYVVAPRVLAPNDTAATDVSTVRYWTRLYDADTLAVLTGWRFGGTAMATDTAPAQFGTAGRAYGQAYSVKYSITTTARVRVQYYVAWYRADGTVRATSAPGASTYRIAQLLWFYGVGYVPTLTTTGPTC